MFVCFVALRPKSTAMVIAGHFYIVMCIEYFLYVSLCSTNHCKMVPLVAVITSLEICWTL